MAEDEAATGQEPTPTGDMSAEPDVRSETTHADDETLAERRGMTGWLRGAFTRPRPALPDALATDALATAPITLDPMRRATRAGETLVALAPGAPIGVVAPEGAPRVARIVGRESALDQTLAALAAGSSLCVHSAGTPGVGKTTFAVEAVSRAAERRVFPGGAVWISCESLSGDTGFAEIITRVARALGVVRALAALDPEARLAELTTDLHGGARSPTLLALDDVEPTLDVAALLNALAGGSVTLLLTTSHVLEDARLSDVALPPLAAPDAERLFIDQMRLRDPQRPYADDAAYAPGLTQTLGGVPFMIDLVAAMAGVYQTSLGEVMAECAADASKGAIAAQRARIDRLWQTLAPLERRTLAGLTLIDGATFPRAVALAVARGAEDDTGANDNADASGVRRGQAAQALDALIGLGAVEAMAAGRLRLHAQTRHRLAPRLAELDPATQDLLGQAMAGWWLSFAREHGGYEGRAGLEAEAAGLMGALTWAHAHGHSRLTLDIAESLNEAWRAHGRRDEALRIATWAAEAADLEGQPRERLWANYQLAVAQMEAGKLAQAQVGFAEALALARELHDRAAIRDGAHALAALAARAGDIEAARAGYLEALAIAREMEDAVTVRDELHGLAILDTRVGKLDEALAAYEEALTLARALADPAAIALELHGLALTNHRRGELDSAQINADEALELARGLGDHNLQADILTTLGALRIQQSEFQGAREALGLALDLAERISDPRRAARALAWLGEVEAAQGAAQLANQRFGQAQAIYARLGDAEADRLAERQRALGA